MNEHIDFEMLNDYADDLLPASERVRVEQHVAACAECRREWVALRELLDLTAAAPRSIEPPSDDWTALRAELERRKEVVLPSSGRHAHPAWRRRAMLAAAALALVASSSAVTAIVMRGRAPAEVAVAPGTQRVDSPALPVAYSATEADYLRTVAELAEALEAQRPSLAPSTIATVERSLRVIDDAIAEARDALANDPGNRVLVDILSANYERKLELLKRAAELSSHI